MTEREGGWVFVVLAIVIDSTLGYAAGTASQENHDVALANLVGCPAAVTAIQETP